MDPRTILRSRREKHGGLESYCHPASPTDCDFYIIFTLCRRGEQSVIYTAHRGGRKILIG